MVKFVLLIMLFFSITSWTIIIFKYNYLRKAYKESVSFSRLFWKSESFADAFSMSKQFGASPLVKIFRAAYMELRKTGLTGSLDNTESAKKTISGTGSGIENIARTLRKASDTELTKMTQLIPFLATTGNTTPFIGLFGTVWGIMNAFRGISLKGSASLAVVAPGISEALIATAAGLAVAIPAVIAYNYFSSKISVIESELASFSADLLNMIERDI